MTKPERAIAAACANLTRPCGAPRLSLASTADDLVWWLDLATHGEWSTSGDQFALDDLWAELGSYLDSAG